MSSVKKGMIFKTSNCGEIEVLTDAVNGRSLIKFIETGFERKASVRSIKSGMIKDRMKPVRYGVGFIGVGKFKSYEDGVMTKEYKAWSGMLRRCYCKKTHEKQPTYKDCKVCDDWLDFQLFADWYNKSSRGMEGGLEVDKDIKVKNNKIYSPETCKLVIKKENLSARRITADPIFFENKDGRIEEVRNVNSFCRDEGLTQSAMSRVARGKIKSHKGWFLCDFQSIK